MAVNILYQTCTFNFRPKFNRRSSFAVSASFFGHTIALGIFGFFAENQTRGFLGFFDLNQSRLVQPLILLTMICFCNGLQRSML